MILGVEQKPAVRSGQGAIEIPISIAPMMDRTDRHYRYFMRQITPGTLFYTEMVTAQAILHGDRQRLLGFTPAEKPLVLQVGGDDPTSLATCARLAAEFGYDGINLNVGCPSDRVRSGNFGACLMYQPERVATAVAAMVAASPLPVSVKHRIGVDDRDRYEDMADFVSTVAAAGCRHFTVHARKAWLQGLSPKDNRTIPPLRYGDVYRLKQEFPHLWIEINGGITQLPEVQDHLKRVDGAMIGRAAHPSLPVCRGGWAVFGGYRAGAISAAGGGGHAALHRNLAGARAKAQQNYPPHADAVCRSTRQSPVEAAPNGTILPARGRAGGGEPGPGGGQWPGVGGVSTGWGGFVHPWMGDGRSVRPDRGVR